MTAVRFELTPFRTGALNRRLRPLGHAAVFSKHIEQVYKHTFLPPSIFSKFTFHFILSKEFFHQNILNVILSTEINQNCSNRFVGCRGKDAGELAEKICMPSERIFQTLFDQDQYETIKQQSLS